MERSTRCPATSATARTTTIPRSTPKSRAPAACSSIHAASAPSGSRYSGARHQPRWARSRPARPGCRGIQSAIPRRGLRSWRRAPVGGRKRDATGRATRGCRHRPRRARGKSRTAVTARSVMPAVELANTRPRTGSRVRPHSIEETRSAGASRRGDPPAHTHDFQRLRLLPKEPHRPTGRPHRDHRLGDLQHPQPLPYHRPSQNVAAVFYTHMWGNPAWPGRLPRRPFTSGSPSPRPASPRAW